MEKNNDSHNDLKTNCSFSITFQKTESFLISHKSFLEIILEQIKYYQYIFLSEKKNIKKIKKYLNAMKKSLSSILKEQSNSKKFIEKEIKSKKTKLQNELYDKIINKDIRKNHFNSIDGINYIQNNSDIKKNNKINYINEKRQLEILCFKAENEISKIEFEIQKKINLIIDLRTSRFNQEENLEILTDQKKYKSKAYRIMKKNLKNCQQDLLQIINKKIKNDIKANKIKEEIESLKKQIKNKEEYIDSDNIIYEDSSDCTRSILINDNLINENRIDEKEKEKEKIKNLNKIINNKEIKNRYSLDIINNIDDIYNIKNKIKYSKMNFNDINEKLNTKVIRSLSNKIKKINFKNLENNCKLNINFNFNVNNLNIINGKSNEEKVTYTNKSFNEKNYDNIKDDNDIFGKKDKNIMNYDYNSDKDEKKVRTKKILMNIKNSFLNNKD
jgi:hypothetical protein